jgi:hypothetical protein
LQVVPRSPLTDSNRRPPPYHALVAATGRNRRQRFWLVFAVSPAGRFASGCDRLQPRGSIKAPSAVVYIGDELAPALRRCAPRSGGRGGGVASSQSVSSVPPPPRFRPAPGWFIIKPGRSEPSVSPSMAVAVTAADAAALRPFAPFRGFTRLRPRGIIVWATTLVRAGRCPSSLRSRGHFGS